MTLSALCARLAAAGIARVEVTYSGSGDEGNIDDAVAWRAAPPGGDMAELNASEFRDHDELCRDWVSEALAANRGGWEINDGSEGTATVDVAAGTAKFDHYDMQPVADGFELNADADVDDGDDELVTLTRSPE